MSHVNPFVIAPPPAPPPIPAIPAPFGRRAAAFAVDLFSVLACLVPGFVYLQILAVTTPPDPSHSGADAFAAAFEQALPLFLFGLIAGALLQFGLLTFRSRSLGKHLLGLRITRTDGSTPGFFRLICVRTPLQLFTFIPVIGQVLFVSNIFCSLMPPHHAVHDRLSGTQVVLN